MAEHVKKWGAKHVGKQGYSAIGGVVGATFPSDLIKIRSILPNAFILIPGYGAQGGSIGGISSGFNEDGLGAIINSSRGIMHAWKGRFKEEYKSEDYARAALEEVKLMKKNFSKFLRI